MKKLYLFLLLMCTTFISLQAQRAISGNVIDEEGEPLIGVNVVAKGSSVGTITDFDGNYSLEVPDGTSKLTYSYIGYLVQIVDLGASNVMDITLKEDAVGIDEVVVTALGIAREKKALGYATQAVETTEITNSNEQNLVSALAAKSAGVQVTSSSGVPGGGAFIKIRGNSTITGNNQPLFVVDGVPINNSTSSTEGTTGGVAYSNRAIDINPNDIAELNILKGPAAVALYGSQAASGAIIITTKNGSGAGKGKGLNVAYTGGINTSTVNKLPLLNDQYGQGSGGNYFPPSSGASGSWGPLLSDLSYSTEIDPVTGDRLIVLNDDATASGALQGVNNMEDFFQTGIGTDHHLSISGASDKASYFISAGRSYQTGIVPLSNFARNTLKLSGDTKLSDKINVFSSVSYTNSGGRRVQQGSNLSGVMLGLLRTPPSFDNSKGQDDPEFEGAYLNEDGTQRSYRGGGGYDNPYWTINQNPFNDDVNRFFGNAGVRITPFDFMSVTYRAGFDTYSDRRKQIYAIGSRNYPSGRVVEDQFFFKRYTSDLLLNFNYDVTEDLTAELLLGHNFQTDYFNNIYTTGDELVIPNFYNLSNALTINPTESGESISEFQLGGVYAQLKLGFMRMLYLDLGVRRDEASSFGSAKSSFWYPSASLGFVFTEALGLTDSKILSFGKLRLSYANVGIAPNAYKTRTVFTQTSYGGGYLGTVGFPFSIVPFGESDPVDVAGFTLNNLIGNDNLEPERQGSFEIGTDLRFFNGRMTLDASYYNQRTTGAIIDVPVAPSAGYQDRTANAAVVENKGFEAVVGFTPIQTKNFSWDATVNFSANKNTVIELAEGVDAIGLSGFTGLQSRAVAETPYGALFGGRWLRNDAGDIVIENNPNAPGFGYPIVDPTEGVVGDPNPDWIMGIRNTLNFGGISVSALLDIKKGGDMWNGTKGALSFFGASEFTENRGDVVVFDGVGGTLEDIDDDGTLDLVSDGAANNVSTTLSQSWFQGNGGGFGAVAETFVEDASWIRLRDLSVSYSLPKNLTEKIRTNDISITLSGRNLFLFTPYEGIDPETNLTGQTNGFGLDYFNMPNTKGFAATVSVKF